MPAVPTVLDRLRRDLLLAGGKWPDGFDRRAGELLKSSFTMPNRIRQLIQIHDGGLHMSQAEIAALIGSQRETVTRVMRKMPDVRRVPAPHAQVGGRFLYTLVALVVALPAFAQTPQCADPTPTAPCTTSDWVAEIGWCAATGPVSGYRIFATDSIGVSRQLDVGNVTRAFFDQKGLVGDVKFTVLARDAAGNLGPAAALSKPNRPDGGAYDHDASGKINPTDFTAYATAFASVYARGCEPR